MRIGFTTTLAAAAALSLFLGNPPWTQAADIPAPVLKAPVAVSGPSWTGFYVNGGFGYSQWAADTYTTDPRPFLDALHLSQRYGGRGWLARVGGGFDYQFSQRIVLGVFADYDFADVKGTIADPFVSLSANIKQQHAWAVGARGGWLVNPSLLSYFTGGYTQTAFSSGAMIAFAPSPFLNYSTPGFTREGWFLGGGAEVALGGGWFGRAEYRYSYFGSQILSDTSPTPPAPFFGAIQNIHFMPTVQTVTMQLVYKVNPGIPSASAAAPARVVAARWNGIYANAGVGYGLWQADETTTRVPGSIQFPIINAQRLAGKGWLGRAGVGFDRQFNERIVAGVFADADISRLKGTIQDAAIGLGGDTEQDWSAAAGVRAGWLITQETLAYVNGGYTATHFTGVTMRSMVTGQPFLGLTTPAFMTNGWFVGGGFEAALGAGWFWRNEYRYAEYGRHTVSDTSSDPTAAVFFAGPVNNIGFKPRVQTVTTQLVYRFNWPD